MAYLSAAVEAYLPSSWLTVLGCCVLYLLLNPLARFRLRKVPGPSPLPLLGNLAEIKTRGECFALDYWTSEYGSIFKVWIGPTPMWVISDPDMSRSVLSRNADRPPFPVEVNEKFRKSLLAVANGQHYRLLKSAWSPMFLPASLQNYVSLMDTAAKNLIESMRPHAGGLAFDVLPLFEAQTMETVVSAAFGVELHTQKGDPLMEPGSEDIKLVHAAYTLLENGAAGAASRWAIPLICLPSLNFLFRYLARALPDSPLREFKRAREQLLGFVYKLIHEERMAQKQSADLGAARRQGVRPGSFLSLLIAQAQNDVQLTEEEIAIQAYFFILAGFQTTSDALSYTLYHLAGHPDKLRAAQAEVDAAGPDFAPTQDNLQDFPYLDACVRETLRLFPPIPSVKRLARDSMAIGPYNAAAGDMLCAATYTIHRNADLWDHPTHFAPERFLTDKHKPDIKRGSWAAFGEGMRSCIGGKFGLMEVQITLIRLLQAYTFQLAPNQVPLAVKTQSFPPLLSPAKGVHVSVSAR
ncbi:hypothetical protein WJX74_003820 [Apatococcus lobatus]|uniref:Cytochrome P450 n=1 Tax=Apatococcus lobatus TaxID=904363 RepID=A0AAW1QI98_9CHLO